MPPLPLPLPLLDATTTTRANDKRRQKPDREE